MYLFLCLPLHLDYQTIPDANHSKSRWISRRSWVASERWKETFSYIGIFSDCIISVLEVSSSLLQNYLLKFDENFPQWKQAVECAAELDCILSLAYFVQKTAGQKKKNASVAKSVFEPFFLLRKHMSSCVYWERVGGHEYRRSATSDPRDCVWALLQEARVFFFSFSFLLSKNDAVIPNTIRLGGVDDRGSSIPPVILLTGPNMGGKSTLLRAACLATIMAQVPCSIFLLPMLVHLLIIYLSSLDRLLHPRCQVRAVSCG